MKGQWAEGLRRESEGKGEGIEEYTCIRKEGI